MSKNKTRWQLKLVSKFCIVCVSHRRTEAWIWICNTQMNVISSRDLQMCVFTSKPLLLLPKLLDNHKFSHDPRSLRLSAPKNGSVEGPVLFWLLAVTHWLVISYLTRHTLTNRCFLLSCYWTTRSTTQTNDAQLKMKNDKVNFKEKNQCCDQENVITLMLQSLSAPRDAPITHFHYHFRQF